MESRITPTTKMTVKLKVPITIAIPTIGRVELLSQCLQSIFKNTHTADEILILDQSNDDKIYKYFSSNPDMPNLRVIQCTGIGISRNMNLALKEAKHSAILVTHDDCEVSENWIITSYNWFLEFGGIVTGNVLPPPNIDSSFVPALRRGTTSFDYTNTNICGALYPNNMILDRDIALKIGGFDERKAFNTAAEDLDFAFRWLKANNQFHYEPSMVVIHKDWRSEENLKKLYKRYALSAGAFYAKHLIRGNYIMLSWIIRDFRFGLFAWKNKLLKKSDNLNIEHQLLIPYMPMGVLIELLYETKYLLLKITK